MTLVYPVKLEEGAVLGPLTQGCVVHCPLAQGGAVHGPLAQGGVVHGHHVQKPGMETEEDSQILVINSHKQ